MSTMPANRKTHVEVDPERFVAVRCTLSTATLRQEVGALSRMAGLDLGDETVPAGSL